MSKTRLVQEHPTAPLGGNLGKVAFEHQAFRAEQSPVEERARVGVPGNAKALCRKGG